MVNKSRVRARQEIAFFAVRLRISTDCMHVQKYILLFCKQEKEKSCQTNESLCGMGDCHLQRNQFVFGHEGEFA